MIDNNENVELNENDIINDIQLTDEEIVENETISEEEKTEEEKTEEEKHKEELKKEEELNEYKTMKESVKELRALADKYEQNAKEVLEAGDFCTGDDLSIRGISMENRITDCSDNYNDMAKKLRDYADELEKEYMNKEGV